MTTHNVKVYSTLAAIGIFEMTMVWMLMNFNPGPRLSRAERAAELRRAVLHLEQPATALPSGCSVCRLCQVKDGTCQDGLLR